MTLVIWICVALSIVAFGAAAFIWWHIRGTDDMGAGLFVWLLIGIGVLLALIAALLWLIGIYAAGFR